MKKSEIIAIKMTPEQIEESKTLIKYGALKDSILKGEGNKYSAIGQIAVRDYFKEEDIEHKQTANYNFIINGKKVAVKTKSTNRFPEEHYNCSVALPSINQKCDVYFFCRTLENLSMVFLIGWIEKEKFDKISFLLKEGEKDGPKFTAKGNCMNVRVFQLIPFQRK